MGGRCATALRAREARGDRQWQQRMEDLPRETARFAVSAVTDHVSYLAYPDPGSKVGYVREKRADVGQRSSYGFDIVVQTASESAFIAADSFNNAGLFSFQIMQVSLFFT
jgi:hypothetical protein